MDSKEKSSGNVMVVCRARPLNNKEIEKGAKCCLEFHKDKKNIAINMASETSAAFGANRFIFDHIFDMKSTQKEVYDAAARPIIDSVLDGFNGTIFAYGQTSSGKTHTMQGPDISDVENQGIIPRMVRTIFNRIETASENIEFTVKISMSEIYNERIKDLMDPSKDNLKIHEEKGKGVYIQDITEIYCSDEQEIYALMKQGNSNRAVTSTQMNDVSSRSHALFVLTITMDNRDDGSCKVGKLFLVDLAGSEKISKTGAQGQVLEEAKNINKSLTTLGKVIVALTDKKVSHIPYRESKLTRILSESLGGNSRTLLIITCSPHPFNDAETLSTLRFGARARNIKNAPKVNKEYTVPELKRLLEKAEEKIDALKKHIKILEKQILEQGGSLPDEDTLKKVGMKLMLEEQLKDKVQLQMAIGSTESESIQEISAEQPEMTKQFSYMSEGKFNGEITTPSKIEENEQIQLEELQVKQEEIERLTELLNKEKEKLNIAQKQVADLNESVKLAEERTQQAIDEREKYNERSKEAILKSQQLREECEDKQILIDELESKQNLVKDQMKIQKEANDMLQKKIDQIYNHNILIPKEGKDNEAQERDDKNQKQEFMNNIQEEVRKLHYQLQSKDQIITQLKHLIQKNADPNQLEDNDQQDELQRILQTNSNEDDDDTKQFERIIIELMQSDKMASESDLNAINFSTLIGANDLRLVLMNRNKQLHQIKKAEMDALEQNKEIEQLKQAIEQQLKKEQPNMIQMQERMVKQECEKLRVKYEAEKEQLHKDLLNRVEKVLKLEMQLDEVKDAYKQLENSISRDDLKFKQKAQNLEKNLDQIHQMYQNVTSEKSILKVDLQVAERKLARKEEKCAQLENQVKNSRQKQQDYLNIIKQLKQEFLKVQSQSLQLSQLTRLSGNEGHGGNPVKIHGGGGERKTIRGGGGKKQTPRYIK